MDTEKLNKLKDETGVVMVEFYATWCSHCQRMMPVVEDVKEQVKGHAAVYRFDIDKNQELADRLGAQSIPTFIIYDKGEEVWRHVGETTEENLLLQLDSALNER